MARRPRASALETRTNLLRLAVRKKPRTLRYRASKVDCMSARSRCVVVPARRCDMSLAIRHR
jgi:hypothetical protein